jgi:hypothetical protein
MQVALGAVLSAATELSCRAAGALHGPLGTAIALALGVYLGWVDGDGRYTRPVLVLLLAVAAAASLAEVLRDAGMCA